MNNMESVNQSPAAEVIPMAYRRKVRWPRLLLWLAGGLLALLVLAAVAGVLWLRAAAMGALPQLDGEIHLAEAGLKGLSAPVIVRRDGHGVPHIEAANEDDLFAAQGYVTAQDRLWQMDLYRRNANGELAEILGASMVKHDREQRVLQIRNTARRIYSNLAAGDRARLDDYARGVNLFIAQHPGSLPPEFKLLGYRPQPWSGADSVSVGLMMVETLDTHAKTKLEREKIATRLNNPRLEADLYPVGSWRDHPPTGMVVDWSQPRPAPVPSKDDDEDDDDHSQANVAPGAPDGLGVDVFHLSDKIQKADPTTSLRIARMGHPAVDGELIHLLGQSECDGCAPGSNNWVIAGRHTASGKPLLANDMHLSLTEPDVWYMADLRAPGFHAAGVTAPGMPFVIAGHNEHVAWGFTALYADVQDLYVEKLDGKGSYQAMDGSWRRVGVAHEVIKVRLGKDVTLDVQSTAHGPLVNSILPKETRAIALKWTLYDQALNTMPFYAMNTAANWAEFSSALGEWCWPAQNVVYSDDQGHIAYHAVGRLPLRPAGLAGVPISDASHEWSGYIPFDAMPSAVDPPSGFLATANSRVTTGKSPYPLSLEWIDPYRVERIYKSLEGRDHLTPADMLAIQTDVYSEVDQELGHRFAYAIDHTPGAEARLKKAADLMRSWDGRLTTDSAAASIVTLARRALWPMILKPKLGDEAGEYRWGESNFAEEEIIMHASSDWLPPTYKNWDALLTDAVRKGMDEGKAPTEVVRWNYGSWHVVDVEHPLANFLPFLSRMAGTGEQPQSGDTTTVKQVGRTFGPSQRFTMDWSNVDGSTENIVQGESGNPYSPYFHDQWKNWYGGTTFELAFTPNAVAAETRHTLRLLP
jgi:penicillin amidase